MTQEDERGIGDALRALKTANGGIRGAFLSSTQGRFLGSTELSGVEKVRIAAVSAASMAIATKGASDLQLGSLKQVTIAGDDGSILLLSVGSRAVLTLLAAPGAETDNLLRDARRAVDRLGSFV